MSSCITHATKLKYRQFRHVFSSLPTFRSCLNLKLNTNRSVRCTKEALLTAKERCKRLQTNAHAGPVRLRTRVHVYLNVCLKDARLLCTDYTTTSCPEIAAKCTSNICNCNTRLQVLKYWNMFRLRSKKRAVPVQSLWPWWLSLFWWLWPCTRPSVKSIWFI